MIAIINQAVGMWSAKSRRRPRQASASRCDDGVLRTDGSGGGSRCFPASSPPAEALPPCLSARHRKAARSVTHTSGCASKGPAFYRPLDRRFGNSTPAPKEARARRAGAGSGLENAQHLGHQGMAYDITIGQADDGDVADGFELFGDGSKA